MKVPVPLVAASLVVGAAIFVVSQGSRALAAAPGEASTPAASGAVAAASAAPANAAVFVPPTDADIPDNDFGKEVRLGQSIFNETGTAAAAYVGNSLRCANCHLDQGRLANSAPMWAAYVAYPAYRSKNGHVNTFAERLQGCFRYSMNGKAPPLGDKVLVSLESYAYFLATGAPTGVSMAGHGYPTPAKPALAPAFTRGRAVFEQKCSLCHGADGQGQMAHGTTVFPPLWGPHSFNWGAGMASIKNAAGFIKANMPLSQGNTLTDQQAWDVATYMDSQERPQDPRFTGSVAETQKKYHGSGDMYGKSVNGVVLGSLALKK
jgi:thiosulfate dehydrogenase